MRACSLVLGLALAGGLAGLPAAPAAAAGSEQIAVAVRTADGHLSIRRVDAGGMATARRAGETVVATAALHRVELMETTDPLSALQWGGQRLRLADVRSHSTGEGQVVAVLDTGVDAAHPDLAGSVLPGRDFVDSGDGGTDANGHGTHVAGIIAAHAGNGIGGSGVAPGASILPVRVMRADGTGWDSDSAAGLVWAADHGANVANLSFGAPARSSVMDAAIDYALDKGVTVVVAAGNRGAQGDPVMWPAASPGVIAVAAADAHGGHPSWSSSGRHVALSAPGVAVWSTVPSGYAAKSGTSMAAPYVAGAAALLRQVTPALSPAQVRARLTSTAQDLGVPGDDPQFGAGMLDVAAALGISDPAPTPAPAAAAPAASHPVAAQPAGQPDAGHSASPAPRAAAPQRPVRTVRLTIGSAPRGTHTVAARVLVGRQWDAVAPVELQRRTTHGWVRCWNGSTHGDGLVRWQLRLARGDYRAVSAGSVSTTVQVR